MLSAVCLQVCLMLARGSGGSKGEGLDEDEGQIKAVHMKHSANAMKAQQDLSPPLSPTDSASFYSSKCACSLPCTSSSCQPAYACNAYMTESHVALYYADSEYMTQTSITTPTQHHTQRKSDIPVSLLNSAG